MCKGFAAAIMTESWSLSALGVPEKRHLGLRLPVGFTYKAGDHLQVLPRNFSNDTRNTLSQFDVEAEILVRIKSRKGIMGSRLRLDTIIMIARNIRTMT